MYENYTQNEYEDLAHIEVNQNESIPKDIGANGPKKHKKKGNGTLKSAVNGIVFGLCGALVFCGVVAIGNRTFLKAPNTEVADVEETTDDINEESSQVATDVKIPNTETAKDKITQTSNIETGTMSIAQIAESSMPSIVSITTKGVEEVRSMFGTQQYESQGAGSGIIVGQNDTELLIATNNHVVSGATEVSVCFDDSEDSVVSAKVKGTDPSNDLAIVSVSLTDIHKDVLNNVKIATIGDSKALSVGDQVVAIGNALGYGQSVTTGIVSAQDREVEMGDIAAKLIQTDAAINPGNSGGALFNMKGELVGINSAKFASNTIEGMGYAIPIATAKPILDNLMTRETRDVVSGDEAGFLGVSCQDVSEEATKLYNIPEGAYIAEVESGSGAEKAGIKKGDIITGFDGLTITSASDLKGAVAYYKVGETVEVVLMRSDNGAYKEQKVSVTLTKSDTAQREKNSQNNAQNNQQGNEGSLEIPQQNDGGSSFFGGDGSLEDFFNQFNGGFDGSGMKQDNKGNKGI